MNEPLFIEGVLNTLYKSGKRPNLKEPKSSLPKVSKGFTMPVKTSFDFKPVFSMDEHCDKDDCFIKNNWFGASPRHPGNREAVEKCRNCYLPKVPNKNL